MAEYFDLVLFGIFLGGITGGDRNSFYHSPEQRKKIREKERI